MSGISEAMQGERAVLGAMLMSPDYAVPLAVELVTSSDFGFKLHQQAFEAIEQTFMHAVWVPNPGNRRMHAPGKYRDHPFVAQAMAAVAMERNGSPDRLHTAHP